MQLGKIRHFSSVCLLTLLLASSLASMLSACKSSQFVQNTKPEKYGDIECSFSPATSVEAGKPLNVNLLGGELYEGRIKQSVRGPEPQEHILVKKAGSEVFVREDGSANVLYFSKSGDYQATYTSLDYEAGLTTACAFTVFGLCPTGKQRVGVNVVFVVDNSNSHGTSDCPDSVVTDSPDPEVKVYKCQGETNREKAVSSMSSKLDGYGIQGGSVAESHVSFVYFPQTSTTSGGWHNASEDLQSFTAKLEVLRRPSGVTPYLEGLEQAKALLNSVPDRKKAKLVIFITDGFPTDKDPDTVLQVAKDIQAGGAKIVSIIVTGEANQRALRQRHRRLMADFTGWPSLDEAYFLKLVGNGTEANPGLLEAMSTEVHYLKDMKDLADLMIRLESIECR